MAQQYIFKGLTANDKTGTPARTAADYINNNFAELYGRFAIVNGNVFNLRKTAGNSAATPETGDIITNGFWDQNEFWDKAVYLGGGVDIKSNWTVVSLADGDDGDSAYQIWLNAGNTGTETDFLNALKGAKGDTGIQGVQGVQGDPGDDGADGIDGKYFKTAVHFRTSTSSVSSITGLATDADFIFQNVSGQYYLFVKKTGSNVPDVVLLAFDEPTNILQLSLMNGTETIADLVFTTEPAIISGLDSNYHAFEVGEQTVASGIFNIYETNGFVVISGVGSIPVVTDDKIGYDVNGAAYYVNNIVIPEGVIEIAYEGFKLLGISSVVFPESLTSIGESAFQSNNITTLTIPSSVTDIGEYAFQSNNITTLTIPSGVTDIGDRAFTYNKLNSLIISEGVASIGNDAFRSNELTTLTIPSSVTNIGSRAFQSNNLTTLTIPSSVTNIGDEAFNSNNLTSVSLPTGITLGVDVFDSGVVISYY